MIPVFYIFIVAFYLLSAWVFYRGSSSVCRGAEQTPINALQTRGICPGMSQTRFLNAFFSPFFPPQGFFSSDSERTPRGGRDAASSSGIASLTDTKTREGIRGVLQLFCTIVMENNTEGAAQQGRISVWPLETPGFGFGEVWD